MIGKVPQELLDSHVLGRTGAPDERVLQGPAYGEDTGAIQLSDGILVVSTDPISLAVDRLGTLGVYIACNDVAASGADPRWLSVSIFLPSDDPDVLETITTQLDERAAELGVTIVTGHSEYTPALERPMLVLTAFGLTDRYVPSGGAREGDGILMTKTAATEATAIIASDFGDEVRSTVDETLIERGRRYYDYLGVIEEARLLREAASAMHDPTEGGLLNGLIELAHASSCTLEVDRDAIPISEETRVLCEAVGVDPLRIFSSGVLLATIPADALESCTARLDEQGIPHSEIGTVTGEEGVGVSIDDEYVTSPIRDEMYALWE